MAGGKIKEIGTEHWLSPNTGADNSSGFTAIPEGGHEGIYGSFSAQGVAMFWWTSTEDNATEGVNVEIDYNHAAIFYWSNDKSCGFSVRCIRD